MGGTVYRRYSRQAPPGARIVHVGLIDACSTDPTGISYRGGNSLRYAGRNAPADPCQVPLLEH